MGRKPSLPSFYQDRTLPPTSILNPLMTKILGRSCFDTISESQFTNCSPTSYLLLPSRYTPHRSSRLLPTSVLDRYARRCFGRSELGDPAECLPPYSRIVLLPSIHMDIRLRSLAVPHDTEARERWRARTNTRWEVWGHTHG